MPPVFDNLSFRPLTRADLAMLHEWVQRPHVAEWWTEPRALTEIENEYLPTIEGTSSTKAYIACLDGQSIGFIQAYVVKDSGEGWWVDEADPGARGIDLRISRHRDRQFHRNVTGDFMLIVTDFR